MTIDRRFLLISLIISVWLSTAANINAHGGGTPYLVNADVGPYWISTWVQPDPPQTKEFHMTIALAEADPEAKFREAGPPILDALIQVQLRSLDQPDTVVSAVASHENAVNKFFYEADFALPHPGQWESVISVTGPDGGSGTISFEVEVVESAVLPIRWLLVGSILIFFTLTFWMMRGSLVSKT